MGKLISASLRKKFFWEVWELMGANFFQYEKCDLTDWEDTQNNIAQFKLTVVFMIFEIIILILDFSLSKNQFKFSARFVIFH